MGRPWSTAQRPWLSCCRRAWLKEESSKGERENALEGRDSGVHFVSLAHAHARGELAGMQAARAPRDLQRLCTVSATEIQFKSMKELQYYLKHTTETQSSTPSNSQTDAN